jgi:putative holliday junction resolvase
MWRPGSGRRGVADRVRPDLPREPCDGYHSCVRTLGLDLGAKRIGVAITDASGTLARPLEVLTVPGGEAVRAVAALVDRLAAEDEGLAAIVVGLPRRLDGSPNDQTPVVLAFVEALRARVTQPIALQDERLTSVEAESRLALRDRDWRSRKKKLDAAAAAIILQDYLDAAAQAKRQAK